MGKYVYAPMKCHCYTESVVAPKLPYASPNESSLYRVVPASCVAFKVKKQNNPILLVDKVKTTNTTIILLLNVVYFM